MGQITANNMDSVSNNCRPASSTWPAWSSTGRMAFLAWRSSRAAMDTARFTSIRSPAPWSSPSVRESCVIPREWPRQVCIWGSFCCFFSSCTRSARLTLFNAWKARFKNVKFYCPSAILVFACLAGASFYIFIRIEGMRLYSPLLM